MKIIIIVNECKLGMGNSIGFIFELLFDLFYENIIVYKKDRIFVILLNMKWNLKIYKNNGKIKKLYCGIV